ncbi:MAG: hypothetical protein BMS9Abin07_0838 [Acidimicrobiia bacterium]|nr:MAG: hypothetical protein BMS9Abin07_0838 [Acidimicrobiia bacterium]
MTRWALLVLPAVLVTACATARAETGDWVTELEATIATSSTMGVVETAAAPTEAATVVARGIAVDVVPGVPISRPAGFPSIDELEPLVGALQMPHPHARISSSLAAVDGLETLLAQGLDADQLNQQMTITYFDGLIIWDAPTGYRQIAVPGFPMMYPGEDGKWQEVMGFEWPVFGPLPDWSMAQSAAVLVLDAEPEIVAYERVADTATVRLTLATGRDRVDVWLDETGAVLRIVQDFTGPDGRSRWLGVWDVETLSPELSGPLPFDPDSLGSDQ